MLLHQRNPFSRVRIEPAEDYLGAVFRRLDRRLLRDLDNGDGIRAGHAAEAVVRVALAGELAVRLHCGARGAATGCGGDRETATQALLKVHGVDGPTCRAHLRYLRAQAADILASLRCRAQVPALAAALLTRGTLNAAESREVAWNAERKAARGG